MDLVTCRYPRGPTDSAEEPKIIRVNEFEWSAQCTILDAIESKGNIVVVFDCMEFPKHGIDRNLYSFTLDGKESWIAENPTSLSSDVYTSFLKKENALWAGNLAGYAYIIDPDTGKLLESVFTK